MRTRSSSTRNSTRSSRRASTGVAGKRTSFIAERSSADVIYPPRSLRESDAPSGLAVANGDQPRARAGTLAARARPRDRLGLGLPRPPVLVALRSHGHGPKYQLVLLDDVHHGPLRRRSLGRDRDSPLLVDPFALSRGGERPRYRLPARPRIPRRPSRRPRPLLDGIRPGDADAQPAA